MDMNFVHDERVIQEIKGRYTVLELDTVLQPGMSRPITLHGVLGLTSLGDLVGMETAVEDHAACVRAYKTNDWSTAKALATKLHGRWQGELDEFYQHVIDFSLESATLGRTWDGVRHIDPAPEDTAPEA
jgi:hypothetical protein